LDPQYGNKSASLVGLCDGVTWGKKLVLYPCSAHSDKPECQEHALAFRAYPRTFGSLALNTEEATVPLPLPAPGQHREPEGL